MPRIAIFRADAGPKIGGGHVQRCLALAETMATRGWCCGFAFRGKTLKTVPALGTAGHLLLPLTGREDKEVEEIVASLEKQCDLFVVDHYQRDTTFETACGGLGARVMAIEDRPVRPHDCDFLLDPTPGRSAADYDAFARPGCCLLLGPEYALLRRQFADARSAALQRHESGSPVERLLVSIGMTDPDNLTTVVLQGISESRLPLDVDVVLGSAAPHVKTVSKQSEAMNARIHLDATNMAALVTNADLAVGASGSSSLERCCLGLPSIAIATTDNQRHLASAFADADAAQVIEANDVTPSRIAETLKRLCGDTNARTVMARAAASLCDGQGAERVVDTLD